MIDSKAIADLVQKQITESVNQHLEEVFKSEPWKHSVEEKIIQYAQDRVVKKFANVNSMPEIIEAVKNSVQDLFHQGFVPDINGYVDPTDLRQAVDLAVENLVEKSIGQLVIDPVWIQKIEQQINQLTTQKILASISAMDISAVIHQRVDQNLDNLKDQVARTISRRGIQDLAENYELTVMDKNVVVENKFTTKDLEVVNNATVKNLAVLGTINTDNTAWQDLKDYIAKKTLDQIDQQWRTQLIDQVKAKIVEQGIDFDRVKVNGQYLITGDRLTGAVVNSNLQSVGELKQLTVSGPARIHDTVNVVSRRLGINTAEPEMALSVWDEETSVLIGKNKAQSAFVGTGRKQNLCLGVNRETQLEIDIDGLTTVKRLRVGQHHISHATELPGWAGIKGDVVFNANPNPSNNVFAWQCLGGHKWKVIRSVE